jgi:hypothetical protein
MVNASLGVLSDTIQRRESVIADHTIGRNAQLGPAFGHPATTRLHLASKAAGYNVFLL